MAWVVDTCVLIDVRYADSLFAQPSALCLNRHQPDGLVISPVTYIELAPAFRGDRVLQDSFLRHETIDFSAGWSPDDTAAAYRLWQQCIDRRRGGAPVRRPLADVLIAAFASRFDGLITRNAADFRTIAPQLTLIDPTAPQP